MRLLTRLSTASSHLAILQSQFYLPTPVRKHKATTSIPTSLSVLRADEIREGLGLLVAVAVAVVVVVVVMGVSLGADVLHLQDVAALRAALDRAVTGHLDGEELGDCTISHTAPCSRGGRTYREPDGDVGIGGIAGAASVLLIAEGLDDDGVIKCA